MIVIASEYMKETVFPVVRELHSKMWRRFLKLTAAFDIYYECGIETRWLCCLQRWRKLVLCSYRMEAGFPLWSTHHGPLYVPGMIHEMWCENHRHLLKETVVLREIQT